MDPLSAFHAELAAAWRERETPSLPTNESETGRGGARALNDILDQLAAQAADGPLSDADQQRTFALALRQVDAQGRPVSRQLNKPDISYLGAVDGTPRRVNIEIETQNLRQHVAAVNRDPAAHNVFVRVHPWTGQILGGLERAPGGTITRPLTAAEAQALLKQLPPAQRDPTLTVHPTRQTQLRRFARATAVRPAASSRVRPTFSGQRAVRTGVARPR
jgi:hypothetical protein